MPVARPVGVVSAASAEVASGCGGGESGGGGRAPTDMVLYMFGSFGRCARYNVYNVLQHRVLVYNIILMYTHVQYFVPGIVYW